MPGLLRALKWAISGRAPGPDQLPGETLKFLLYLLKKSLLDYDNIAFPLLPHRLVGNSPKSLCSIKARTITRIADPNLVTDHCLLPTPFTKFMPQCFNLALPIILTAVFSLSSSASDRVDLFPLRLVDLPSFSNVILLLFIFFLERSQAFDSVSHPALRAALFRYGVPTQIVNSIMAPYHQGQFFVHFAATLPGLILPISISPVSNMPTIPSLFLLPAPTSPSCAFFICFSTSRPALASLSQPF